MQIDLKNLSALEKFMKQPLPEMDKGTNETLHFSETFTFILDALRKYYETNVHDVDTIESYYPIYKNLEEIGVVTDAPEIEVIVQDSDEDEEEDN